MPNSGLVAWKMMMFTYIIFLALSLSIDGSKAQLSENSRSSELGPSFSKAGQPSVRIKPIDISNHLCIIHVQASVFLALVELEPSFFGDFRLWQCQLFEVYLFLHHGTTTAVEKEQFTSVPMVVPWLGVDTSLPCTGSPHLTRFHFTRFTLYTTFRKITSLLVKFTLYTEKNSVK